MSRRVAFDIGSSSYDTYFSDSMGLMLIGVDKGIPEPRIETVEIPGRNGLLDLTECLRNQPLYEDFDITLEFIFNSQDEATVKTKLANLCTAINGKAGRLRMQDASYTVIFTYPNCRFIAKDFHNDGLLWFVSVVARCLNPTNAGGFS